MIVLRRWFVVTVLGAMLIAIPGCYRLAAPADLDQTVRVEVTINNSHLVRSQAYLQQAVADALVNTLGWQVSPKGTAKLLLTIDTEDIAGSGSDSRDTTNRWTITLHGQAMLVSRDHNLLSFWTGTGYASALNSTTDDEPAALRNASVNAAASIVTWLEAQIRLAQSPKPDAAKP